MADDEDVSWLDSVLDEVEKATGGHYRMIAGPGIFTVTGGEVQFKVGGSGAAAVSPFGVAATGFVGPPPSRAESRPEIHAAATSAVVREFTREVDDALEVFRIARTSGISVRELRDLFEGMIRLARTAGLARATDDLAEKHSVFGKFIRPKTPQELQGLIMVILAVLGLLITIADKVATHVEAHRVVQVPEQQVLQKVVEEALVRLQDAGVPRGR